MEIEKLFKDSFNYPKKDSDKLLMFGALIFVLSIISVLVSIASILGPVGITLNHIGVGSLIGDVDILLITLFILPTAIILIIFALIVSGYQLSITENTINDVDSDIPKLKLVKNITDGLKVAILHIVYFIIPTGITLIVAYVIGLFNVINQLLISLVTNSSFDTAVYSLSHSFTYGFRAIFLIAIILFIVFGLMYLIAKAVLAETGSLSAAVNFVNVLKKIEKISWGNYIVWLVIYLILLVIFFAVINFIVVIPIIGIIIAILVLIPYAKIFEARSLGLIYNESKDSDVL